jgi:glutathione peroxidase
MKISGRLPVHGRILENKDALQAKQAIYTLEVSLNNGQALPLQSLQGKKVLLVNTASDCGYTNQYTELQELADRYKEVLQVIGFPANDFKEQEKGSDAQIAQFCSRNFGVHFPLAKKSSVIKGPQQHPVFAWLTNADRNGWNNHAPDWNFSKYLLNENGVLTHYFGPAVSPLGAEMKKAVEQKKAGT